MVRRVVLTIPKEHAEEVLSCLEHMRHCHHITISAGDEDFPRFANSVISFKCIDKKLDFIISELQSLGLGREWGSIELISVEATVPYLNSRVDAFGRAVPNRITSVTDRLTIAEIYHAVDDQCHMTFDYLAMCATAGMICGVGLLDDNVVLVVASMLVSPLMGPILAFVYGSMMRDFRMTWKGCRAEAAGVAVIFLVGMVCGALIFPFIDARVLGDWPSDSFQMNVRGEPLNLVVGTFVAIPSGIALALAVTSDVVAPYVGVAIAAALLPPIVNGGLTFMLGIFALAHDGTTPFTMHYLNTSYISMILFLINFVLIYVFGILTFMVKKIHPVPQYDKEKYLSRYTVDHGTLFRPHPNDSEEDELDLYKGGDRHKGGDAKVLPTSAFVPKPGGVRSGEGRSWSSIVQNGGGGVQPVKKRKSAKHNDYGSAHTQAVLTTNGNTSDHSTDSNGSGASSGSSTTTSIASADVEADVVRMHRVTSSPKASASNGDGMKRPLLPVS